MAYNKEIDLKELYRLAEIGLTEAQIADDALGVQHAHDLTRRKKDVDQQFLRQH